MHPSSSTFCWMFSAFSLLSNEWLLPGGGEHTGHPNFTKPQCLLPSHDARWVCDAGRQCVVCKLNIAKLALSTPWHILIGLIFHSVHSRVPMRRFVCVHSHQSGEVSMGSYCRVDSLAGRFPGMLSALEEHDFLFQLHLNDIPQDDSNEVDELYLRLYLSYICVVTVVHALCCMCTLLIPRVWRFPWLLCSSGPRPRCLSPTVSTRITGEKTSETSRLARCSSVNNVEEKKNFGALC